MLITKKRIIITRSSSQRSKTMQLLQIRQQEDGEKGITCETTVFQTTSTYFEKR
jgi:hypothetical protein